jgi:phosphate transport system permease protein
MTWQQYLRRGDPAIWLTGTALGICLLMIGGMLALIMVNGLGFFWPRPLVRLALRDGSTALGEVVGREAIPKPGTAEHLKTYRLHLKLGNRDLTGSDFRWIDESAIASRDYPADVIYIERREYGPFLGVPIELAAGAHTVAGAAAICSALQPLVAKATRDRARIRDLERNDIGRINLEMERLRLAIRAHDGQAANAPTGVDPARSQLTRRAEQLDLEYQRIEQQLAAVRTDANASRITLASVSGQRVVLPTLDIFRAYRPNQLGMPGRVRIYLARLWEFISAEPRESNTEGGIFPAIFGTVMMVLIMSVLAVPFGVLAALYLREYARQGALVRLVRIAVNNLAGVPSIVFGLFGLGFFVYFVGGGIDRVFFADTLPTPTFGTGGILWASLTLGLLTVPVVIVAAEEALASVPRSMREASLAMGATKFQTILRVVLPASAPGILTGLILAMARGAGEVAPLMITGVVKLAPDLAFDSVPPFLHLDRKFMHLGFHIYDVGFQSPNVEAAKPMVYATTILLVIVVVLLNVTAIRVRERLRRRYQASAF